MQVALDMVESGRQRTAVDIVQEEHGGQQEHNRATGSPRAILGGMSLGGPGGMSLGGMRYGRDQVAGAAEFM